MKSKPIIIEGTIYWEDKNGLFHRGGGLPAIIEPDGTVEYYEEGELKGWRISDEE